MAKCPECGNPKMKWENPFYVCPACGVSYRKHELSRVKERINAQIWNSKYGEDEEDEKRKRQEELRRWYEKGMR